MGAGLLEVSSPTRFNPVDLVWQKTEQSLWIASGSGQGIVALDPESGTHRTVFENGSAVVDTEPLPHSHELAILQRDPNQILILGKHTPSAIVVPDYPVDLIASPDGNSLYVLHLWTHQATLLGRSNETEDAALSPFKIQKKLSLPFAPWTQILIHDPARWIVTSAFGGRLAELEPLNGDLLSLSKSPIHNIRDLALGPENQTLWMTHQQLHPDATTLRGDIQWGFLMENRLSGYALDTLAASFASQACRTPRGELERPGNAAGDPEALLWTDRKELVTSLAGVGEIAILQADSTHVHRLGVGKRPTALSYDAEGRRVFVANTLSDSISMVTLDPEPRVKKVFRLTPRGALDEPLLGERLFYDAHQSFHGWFSCHSCHTDGHANGMLNDNESDGDFGAPKKILSLRGVGATAPWGWRGHQTNLLTQVHRSAATTMRQNTTPKDAQALHDFMMTLPPAPGKRPHPDPNQLSEGQILFEKLRCDECHIPPAFTDTETYDTGIADEKGRVQFNPPSLLGVSQRNLFLHDGRAKTLRSVFEDHQHMLKKPLSDRQLKLLTRYLETL